MDPAMVQRVSRCEHEYAGKKVVTGEKFDVEPKHVGLLLLLGRIKPEEGEPGYVPPEEEQEEVVPAQVRKNGKQRRL